MTEIYLSIIIPDLLVCVCVHKLEFKLSSFKLSSETPYSKENEKNKKDPWDLCDQ